MTRRQHRSWSRKSYHRERRYRNSRPAVKAEDRRLIVCILADMRLYDITFNPYEFYPDGEG